ncbi:olfactory receptor 10A7-like [Mantella aurantiaca]
MPRSAEKTSDQACCTLAPCLKFCHSPCHLDLVTGSGKRFVYYKRENLNTTMVNEFILIAFSELQNLQVFLSVFILVAYIICVIGNITIIILIRIDPLLHTPMYSFIMTFAVLEIIFVNVTLPKLLDNLISRNKSMPVYGCFTQMYIFNGLGLTECYLLAIMAFDRDLAINNPLRYSSIMKKELCFGLAVVPWIAGFTISFLTTLFTARLNFCGPNQIDHFFCDVGPLQSLACSNLFVSKVAVLLSAVFGIIFSFIIIITFYIHIIHTILKIKSVDGKKRAFSTCSSHLIIASLFFGTTIIVYATPIDTQFDKFLALIYTVLTPLLNPFIYTLRNKVVRSAVRRSRTLFARILT